MTPGSGTGRASGEYRGRFHVAIAYGVVASVYFVIINSGALDARSAVVLNDVIWTLFGLSAAATCYLAGQRLTGSERRAWTWVAFGCLSWSAGQFVWDYYELIVGRLPAFPHWMQALFMGYPLLLVAGLTKLPKPANVSVDAKTVTIRHAGNLGLIACTLAGVLAIAITEPAALSQRSLPSLVFSLFHITVYAAASMTALYLLWTFRWQSAYWPLVLVVIGSGIHTSAFVADMHSRLAGTYQASDWVNAAWLIALASVACAAHEYAWVAQRTTPKPTDALLKRERMLEATMPALLVIIVAATAVMNAEWITPRVIYLCAAVGLVFAVLLGVREAWIQHEEQRLLAALGASNENLLDTNRNLSDSEQRFRHLNQELEHHVAERTRNLQRAYEELESFSYAVAHDLKAPLRAVDGFGALLDKEYGEHLDDQGRGYIARMRRGALTMANLVDDLLAYARIDRRESHVAAATLKEVIAECIDEQREELERARIALRVDVQDAKLSMDGEGLGIALRNVLQNAIKFGGAAKAPEIAIRAEHENQRLLVSVTDNGIGFEMQYHDRIFAMFQRLHRADAYPGTGIGLAIARKAIERAGGRIWAESTPGVGATFFIELPAAQ